MNELKDLVDKISDEKLGEKILKYKSLEEEFRINYLKEVCSGERDTPEYRELANAFLDFQEKKINKVTFDHIKDKYKHFL